MHKHRAVIAFIVVSIVCGNCVLAGVDFDDGGYHVIDYLINQPVDVDEYTPGAGTRVDLVEGGLIKAWLDAHEDSRVTISGGEIGASLKARGNAHVTIEAGKIGGPIRARDRSVIEISGGLMDSWVQTFDNVEATISGGDIGLFVEAWDSSRITISGGKISERIASIRDALITLVGRDFAVNGTSVGYGGFASDYASSGTLTGTLANGDALNNPFGLIHPGADILFVPEPATVLILGLGSLVLRRRSAV